MDERLNRVVSPLMRCMLGACLLIVATMTPVDGQVSPDQDAAINLQFELRLPEGIEAPRVFRGWAKMALIGAHIDLEKGFVSLTNQPQDWAFEVVSEPAIRRPELWITRYRLPMARSFEIWEADEPRGRLVIDGTRVPVLLGRGFKIRVRTPEFVQVEP